jgi:hypothetical protein
MPRNFVADSIPTIVCSDCGATVAKGQTRCWLCQSKLSGGESQNPYVSPRPVAGENLDWQFSLASLFLIITLVAVNLGAFLVLPGLGVLMTILSLPALVRTQIANSRSKQRGTGLSPLGKVESFIVSVLIVFAIWMASVIAFFAVCTASGALGLALQAPEPLLVAVCLGGGLIAALALAGFLFRITQPGS